ncbi:MAG: type II toxin-antitoxin system Phd/YefM family antitoxin [Bacteroidetes bacterium]|nr:type II toxin-antitoxin system Phd/YefM family antitoxin [Bacteroidota bacterium]
MSLTHISALEARIRLPELIEFIRQDQRRIVIQFEGQRDVVLVHVDELQRLEQRAREREGI